MTIKIKLEYGDTVFIKQDPEQKEYTFVGVIAQPGSIKYELSYLGDVVELFDFEVSSEQDQAKLLNFSEK